MDDAPRNAIGTSGKSGQEARGRELCAKVATGY